MAHQDWLLLLLQYVCVMGFLYGSTHLLLRLLGPRANASLAMAASPEVRARFQPYMEGLRGLLALNIFFVHAVEQYDTPRTGIGYPRDVFNQQIGVMAVYYFFFMTGYLIWKGMVERGHEFRASRFLKGRLYRTFPAYAVVITLIFATGIARSGWHIMVPLWKLVASYVMWLMFSIPGGPAINGIHDVGSLGAGVLWTLQLDWIFYLALPLMAWFGRKRGRVLILVALAAAVYQPLRWHYETLGHIGLRVFFLVSFFVGGFAVGMLLAEFKHYFPSWPFARTRWASALGVLLYFLVPCFVVPTWKFREALLVLPVFILLAYGCDMFGLFNTRAAILLGRISFSIYLLHALVIIVLTSAVRHVFHVDLVQMSYPVYLAWTAVLGVFMLVAAFISHRFIELPFTTLGKRRAAREQIGSPEHPTREQVRVALQEEAAELPGQAEGELLLPQHKPSALR